MKNYRIASFLLLLFVALLAPAACKTKSGCEATESLRAETDRAGRPKIKKHKDGLFSKKMTKKMKN